MSSEETPSKHNIEKKYDSDTDSSDSDSDIEDRIRSIKKRFHKNKFYKHGHGNKPDHKSDHKSGHNHGSYPGKDYYGGFPRAYPQYGAPFYPNFYPQGNNFPNYFDDSSDSSDSDDGHKNKYHDNHKKNKCYDIRDPKYYLNKALFFYYNQDPNFDTSLKPCAFPRKEKFCTVKRRKYFDPVDQKYYEVCEKVNDKDAPVKIKKTYYKIKKPKSHKNDLPYPNDDVHHADIIQKDHKQKTKKPDSVKKSHH